MKSKPKQIVPGLLEPLTAAEKRDAKRLKISPSAYEEYKTYRGEGLNERDALRKLRRVRAEQAQRSLAHREDEKQQKIDPDYQRFMAWCKEVHDRGEWGPSPGGAASALQCSRAMVDKLVNAGVLVRNEYHEAGYHNIRISRASIEKAKLNKETTGKWNEELMPDGLVKVWRLS